MLASFKKKTHIYIKYTIMFFLTCYLKHDTKHIFCFMNTVNTYFHNTFKPQFSHHFKQRY